MKKCFECETTKDLQEHHVVPRSRGGTKTVTLCYQCHMKVHGRSGKGLNHKQLTKMALNKKKKQGYKLGSSPYGYIHSKDRKSFIINEDEQKIIHRTYALMIEGNSYSSIAMILNKEGYRTRRGKEWNKQSVYKPLMRAIKKNK